MNLKAADNAAAFRQGRIIADDPLALREPVAGDGRTDVSLALALFQAVQLGNFFHVDEKIGRVPPRANLVDEVGPASQWAGAAI